jgi:hypothetical protein
MIMDTASLANSSAGEKEGLAFAAPAPVGLFPSSSGRGSVHWRRVEAHFRDEMQQASKLGKRREEKRLQTSKQIGIQRRDAGNQRGGEEALFII